MCQPKVLPSVSGFVDVSSSENNEEGKMKILLISENVPPQVNGIARRIGHYKEGLVNLGHEVEFLHPEVGLDKVLPHVNPWNFTARMMIILPKHFLELLSKEYDIVHCVLPLNLSGMWLIAAFKAMRVCCSKPGPTLVVSWHCNMVDYVDHHTPAFLLPLVRFVLFRGLFALLPCISDRILTPTKSTDPEVVSKWQGRSGVCYTGISKGSFTPLNKRSQWGISWEKEKLRFLKETQCKYLIVCVGRLSPEKGTDELINVMSALPDCALWLVGDGPHRPALELLAKKIPSPSRVNFLGYQKGEDLHAAYAVADLFVCPSLTETFGQTVNEALASQVRVVLPRVPVFTEAYSYVVPDDAFYTPLDREAMAKAIKVQLMRHEKGDSLGVPDLGKLRTWPQVCESLVEEYHAAKEGHRSLHPINIFLCPLWYMVTILASFFIFYLATIRTIFGGSVRVYFKTQSHSMKNQLMNMKQRILMEDI